MASQTWKLRVIEELEDLAVKMLSLRTFLDAAENLPSTQSLELLRIQLDAMNLYASTLDARIRLSERLNK